MKFAACALAATEPQSSYVTSRSVDGSIDERSLQVGLVRLDWVVPVAGCGGSRNPCSSTPAQHPAAPIPEARGLQQHRPALACSALSLGSRACPLFRNPQAAGQTRPSPSGSWAWPGQGAPRVRSLSNIGPLVAPQHISASCQKPECRPKARTLALASCPMRSILYSVMC